MAAGLLTLSLAWEYWRQVGLWSALRWSFWCLPWGAFATVPPVLLILLLESSLGQRVRWLREFREQVVTILGAFLGYLGWADMVLLSCLAGLSEEIFFRGILQPEIGLTLTSLVFGVLHAISLPYLVWATLMGIYLGWLFQLTQNLWLPIMTHTFVDLVGLWYIRRIAAPRYTVV
jgi:hypothetical protein